MTSCLLCFGSFFGFWGVVFVVFWGRLVFFSPCGRTHKLVFCFQTRPRILSSYFPSLISFWKTWHKAWLLWTTRAFAWISESWNSPSLTGMCEGQCSCTNHSPHCAGLMKVKISLLKHWILYKFWAKKFVQLPRKDK